MASSFAEKKCPLCTFQAPTMRAVLSHLRIVHSSDPRFSVVCGVDGCSSTFHTFSAFYSHIYRRHKTSGIIQRESNTATTDPEMSLVESGVSKSFQDDLYTDDMNLADLEYLFGDSEQQRRASALFLIKLKEQRRVTQVTIDDIISGFEGLLQQTVSRARAGVRAKLAEQGIDPMDVVGLDDVFEEILHPFDGLETACKQEKYFKDCLGLVEAQEVKIGDPEYVPRFSGDRREQVLKWDTIQYVPLLSTLERILQDEGIMDQIDKFPERIRTDGKIEDFCDGLLYKTHPLFSADPFALQIIAYYDELELCNPLGTHVKQHKLGIIFFSLGNIHPKYRSTYRAIYLVMAAPTVVVEAHGLNAVLQPFVRDLNKLATEGIQVTVNGCSRLFKGGLLAFLADNLASNALGGFKLSFSMSFRYCRTCLVPRVDASSSYDALDFELRTTPNHLHYCSLIEGAEEPLRSHYSTTYGINTRTCLMDVKYYSLFDGGLPHDMMHDVLEGTASLEIKLLIAHCISSKYFTLVDYNRLLVNFNFGYSDNDKPVPILSTVFSKDSPLKSTASQMLTLIRNLPFIVGGLVPQNDDHWTCFLLLRKIVDILMSSVLPESISATLRVLITDHHTMFVALYGQERYIPKMHFMVHYPYQILNVGPMVRTWTMRHEAKLNFFKKASRLVNFKNVAQSVVSRHQRWFCYQMASSRSKLFDLPLECGPAVRGHSNPVTLQDDTITLREAIIQLFPEISLDSSVFRPTWVRKEGFTYKANNCFLICGSDGLDPKFVKLDELIVLGGSTVVFVTRECRVLYFDDHFHSYVIDVTANKTLLGDLYDDNVYHAHKLNDNLHITLKNYFL